MPICMFACLPYFLNVHSIVIISALNQQVRITVVRDRGEFLNAPLVVTFAFVRVGTMRDAHQFRQVFLCHAHMDSCFFYCHTPIVLR